MDRLGMSCVSLGRGEFRGLASRSWRLCSERLAVPQPKRRLSESEDVRKRSSRLASGSPVRGSRVKSRLEVKWPSAVRLVFEPSDWLWKKFKSAWRVA